MIAVRKVQASTLLLVLYYVSLSSGSSLRGLQEAKESSDEHPLLMNYNHATRYLANNAVNNTCAINYDEMPCLDAVDEFDEPCSWCTLDLGDNFTVTSCSTQTEAKHMEKEEGFDCQVLDSEMHPYQHPVSWDFKCMFKFDESSCLDTIDKTDKPCSWCSKDFGSNFTNFTFSWCTTQEKAEKKEEEGAQCQHNQMENHQMMVSDSEGQPDEIPVSPQPKHWPDWRCNFKFDESLCLDTIDNTDKPCSWCSKDYGSNFTFSWCTTQEEAEEEEEEGAQCQHNQIENHQTSEGQPDELPASPQFKPDSNPRHPGERPVRLHDFSCLKFSSDKSSCLGANDKSDDPCSWCAMEEKGTIQTVCATQAKAEIILGGKGYRCQHHLNEKLTDEELVKRAW